MLLSSLRNFFISLFITLIVFGVAAHFLVGFINENLIGFTNPQPTSGPEEGTTDENDNSDTPENGDTNVFTVLVLGIDDGQSQPRDYENDENDKENEAKREADTIFLININAITRVIMVSSLPCDMKIEGDGYILRLGSVYAHGGVGLMKKAVHAYTGLEADYCFVLDYDSVEMIIDSLGAMEYAINEDMYYKPVPYDVTTTEATTTEKSENDENTEETQETTNRNIINIKKSEQTTNEQGKAVINGAAAIQILRYKNYKNEEYSRNSVQINFVREFVRQKMTLENLTRADELYEKIKEAVVASDMDKEVFKFYTNTLFSLSDFEVAIEPYPGSVKIENGTAFFDPILKSAIERYKKYRKVKEVDLTGESATGGLPN
ncbi:MAG: LCP family protein [Oscillospiraceae bacterium]|nr:LCP family protein [Oscillospiraceae bacterium]